MASFPLMKSKRKELVDVNEDFSDFSLSAPAKKIRRLDADLTPIMEEELPNIPPQFCQYPPQFGASNGLQPRLSEPVIEELPSPPSNDERAIVLFNPLNSSPRLSSAPTFFVHPDLISSIKNRGMWKANSTCNTPTEDDEESNKADKNLAVVPWVPSQQIHQKLTPDDASQLEDFSEPMEIEQSMMDSEDSNALCFGQRQAANECNNLMMNNEGMTQQHWHQQHCLIPQLPQNMTKPVVWYR